VKPFDQLHPLDTQREYTALMISRLDIELHFVDLPPIQDHEIGDLLKYKLRSIYPGTPEKTVFDYIVLGKKNRKYAALFITQKHVIEAYKDIAGGRPLFAPLSLIHPLTERYVDKRCVFAFLHSQWIEVLVYTEGGFKSSCVVRRDDSIHDDLTKLPSIFPESWEDCVIVFLCAGYAHEELQQPLLSWEYIEKIDFEIVTLNNLTRTVLRKSDFLFTEKKDRSHFTQKILLPSLVIVTLLMAVAVLGKQLHFKKVYYHELIARVQKLEANRDQVDRIQREIAAIEGELQAVRERTPNDMYLILSELSEILDQQTKITHFVVERNRFQVEGFGPNPLMLMDRFAANEHFEEVKLSQIVPLKDGDTKRFKVSGFVNTQ
jgi:hypothetical protein